MIWPIWSTNVNRLSYYSALVVWYYCEEDIWIHWVLFVCKVVVVIIFYVVYNKMYKFQLSMAPEQWVIWEKHKMYFISNGNTSAYKYEGFFLGICHYTIAVA